MSSDMQHSTVTDFLDTAQKAGWLNQLREKGGSRESQLRWPAAGVTALRRDGQEVMVTLSCRDSQYGKRVGRELCW